MRDERLDGLELAVVELRVRPPHELAEDPEGPFPDAFLRNILGFGGTESGVRDHAFKYGRDL
ncbi:hypothetical protein GCM10028789_30780 [Sinomonas halotolerans]